MSASCAHRCTSCWCLALGVLLLAMVAMCSSTHRGKRVPHDLVGADNALEGRAGEGSLIERFSEKKSQRIRFARTIAHHPRVRCLLQSLYVIRSPPLPVDDTCTTLMVSDGWKTTTAVKVWLSAFALGRLWHLHDSRCLRSGMSQSGAVALWPHLHPRLQVPQLFVVERSQSTAMRVEKREFRELASIEFAVA